MKTDEKIACGVLVVFFGGILAIITLYAPIMRYFAVQIGIPLILTVIVIALVFWAADKVGAYLERQQEERKNNEHQ